MAAFSDEPSFYSINVLISKCLSHIIVSEGIQLWYEHYLVSAIKQQYRASIIFVTLPATDNCHAHSFIYNKRLTSTPTSVAWPSFLELFKQCKMWLWSSGTILLQTYLYTYSLMRGVTFEVIHLSSYALRPTTPMLETFSDVFNIPKSSSLSRTLHFWKQPEVILS